MIGQLFAGAGLGLLVGILVGLSSSPVVSVIVGSLAAALVTLLGFVSSGKDSTEETSKQSGTFYTENSVVRLGSFGVACAFAVVGGVYMRTHNWASPSIADQVAEVQKAGYSAEEARRWVAFRNIGSALNAPSGDAEKATGTGTAAAPVAASVLFAGIDKSECQHFDTSRYKDVGEHLYALRQLGGKYADYAAKIGSLDAKQQKTALDGLQLLFCAQ